MSATGTCACSHCLSAHSNAAVLQLKKVLKLKASTFLPVQSITCTFTPSSRRYVASLVAHEVAAGIPSHRVAVAGHSQGGAIALLMLRSNIQLGAVIGATCILVLLICVHAVQHLPLLC